MTLYFVEASFGKAGNAFVETDRASNSKASIIQGIASGEWTDVLRVLEVNEDEGTCRDVTEDMAREVLELLDNQYEKVPSWLRNFIDDQIFAGASDKHDASCGSNH